MAGKKSLRQRYISGEYQRELADEFCMSQAGISSIVNGKRWKYEFTQDN